MHIPTATALLLLSTVCAAITAGKSDRNLSDALFAELEESARLADIAYCVGISGIWKPFGCLSRCGDFPDFELVDTWNTGPLRSDSCGYIALDHSKKRIVVAFRGTYSLASALADLATTPQVYVPYPEHPPPASTPRRRQGWFDWIPWFGSSAAQQSILAAVAGDRDGSKNTDETPVCTNCTVHAGFLSSWTHTRPLLLPHLEHLSRIVPDYSIHLIGHSLGGALAALAGLELRAHGVDVLVTTFGEPRIGNTGLVAYLDRVFELGGGEEEGLAFRRVTHVGDPVPLLPLEEWGYAMHGGEIYVSSPGLPFLQEDVERCAGDEDERCIAGADGEAWDLETFAAVARGIDSLEEGDTTADQAKWGLKSRFRIWQLLFAHRDYFWRIGLCVPGGDPAGWGRGRGWYGEDGEEKRRVDEEL